jgi:NADH dehydrogenase [ubiquinone] 1 alpha subcomplex assembly factor 7
MLEQIIKNKILEKDYITIQDFINISLFHPEFGYYIRKNPLGKGSDFITSPEISQIFGEIIAFYLIDFWQRKFPNQEINLVEMGAGQAVLMLDFLNIAKQMPYFFQKINIHIIEINEKLTKIQQENLKNFNVKWWKNFDNFSENCQNLPIFFISNELFDCFAIDQFILEDDIWYQRIIILEENQLKIDKIKAKNDILSLIPKKFRKNLKNKAIFEENIAAQEFMAKLLQKIAKNNGIAINIDYGYYENSFKDTLQSIKNHKFNNILTNIGQSDLTSHIDFYKLTKIAMRNNLNVNFMTQREFLLSNGLELRRKILLESAKTEKDLINNAINRLIDQDQMGDLFKFMIAFP